MQSAVNMVSLRKFKVALVDSEAINSVVFVSLVEEELELVQKEMEGKKPRPMDDLMKEAKDRVIAELNRRGYPKIMSHKQGGHLYAFFRPGKSYPALGYFLRGVVEMRDTPAGQRPIYSESNTIMLADEGGRLQYVEVDDLKVTEIEDEGS